MKRYISWLAAWLLFSMVSCQKEKGKNQVLYDDGHLVLKLKGVWDGRCPTGYMCYWMGNAAVDLEAEMNNEKALFTLNTYGINEYIRDTSFWGYHFKLTEVLPYPNDWEKKKLKEYTVNVLVE